MRLRDGSDFTEEQLNRMSRDDMLSLVKIMQGHYQKQKETLEKQETRIQLLEEKTKELEFLNAMLSDRLTLAQRKRFGASSEKYADGYTQLNLLTRQSRKQIRMPRNQIWKRSIHLLTRGRNVPEKRKRTFPPLRQPK